MAVNSDFKVGDTVQLTTHASRELGQKIEPYIISEIYSDSFGCAALRSPGGYGYGFYYLELTATDKQREQARIRQQRRRDKHKAAGYFEIRGIVTDCQAKAAKIKAAAIEINAN